MKKTVNTTECVSKTMWSRTAP